MKSIISLFIGLAMALQLGAQGIEFFHGSFNEALEESKKTGKPIFMDAYAKWCGPCKRMASTTFKDESVGEYFNKNYINLKIDWEESEGVSLRGKYVVSAFPTLFFIGSDGAVIQKVVGGQDVPGLLRQGEMALGKVDYSREYAALYEKGDRNPELVYNYVKALNKSGKPSLGIANEYLRTQQDLSTAFNRRFILEGAVEADSRIFDLLIKNQKEIGIQEGLQPLRDRGDRERRRHRGGPHGGHRRGGRGNTGSAREFLRSADDGTCRRLRTRPRLAAVCRTGPRHATARDRHDGRERHAHWRCLARGGRQLSARSDEFTR